MADRRHWDILNKIKSYKNSKYVWCAVGGALPVF